jgi:hypothetical protein
MKPAILMIPSFCLSLTAQVQFSPAQRFPVPPQDQIGKASIEGSVLDAITHEPIKKATVALNGRIGLFVVTDASGHFAFRQLPAGQYAIFARNEKYPPVPGSLDADQQLTVSVTAEEQKQDVNFSLIPGGTVRGHIVDEDGNPMPRCNVTTLQFRDTGFGGNAQRNAFSQSDDKGEYRLSNLPRGKYYLEAQCSQSVPLPHAFVRRTSLMDVPTLTYAPLFYPGAADPEGAAKVNVSPGADLSGIDFRMAPARGISIRGHVGAAADRNVQLMLTSKDHTRGDWQRRGVPVNPSTGEFQIRNVLPGSYEVVASASAEGHLYYASASVEVGATPLDPIDLTLAPAPSVSGSISIEGDTKVPMNNMHVAVNPLGGWSMMGPPPQADVQSDGTFTLNSVTPGRWRLNVNGPPGYVKSVKQGDQDVTPWNLEIGSLTVQLKVVLGTKFAQLEMALAAGPAGTETVSAIIFSADGDPQYQQNIGLNSQGPVKLNVPPGKYRACAFALAQPWALMQNHALRKALESRCESVEASEDGIARVQVPLIPAADLKQLLDKIEE